VKRRVKSQLSQSGNSTPSSPSSGRITGTGGIPGRRISETCDVAGTDNDSPSLEHVSSPATESYRELSKMEERDSGNEASPLDETEEWAKIADIMASFGGGVDRDSLTMTEEAEEDLAKLLAGSLQVQSVGDWLEGLGLSQYENIFITNGFDDMDYMGPDILDDNELLELGVHSEEHRQRLLGASRLLPSVTSSSATDMPSSVGEWLESLQLSSYRDALILHDFSTMERVRNIWELELNPVLDVITPGHRKRMLASLRLPSQELTHEESARNAADAMADLAWTQEMSESSRKPTEIPVYRQYNTAPPMMRPLKSKNKKQRPRDDHRTKVNGSHSDVNIGHTQVNGGSLEFNRGHRGQIDVNGILDEYSSNGVNKEDIHIRPPHLAHAESPIKQWRHRPEVLIRGCCTYNTQYLGSTLVRSLQGTESTKESINKLKYEHWEQNQKCSPSPAILLSISYRGVKFIDTRSKVVICEHELSNIFCVCQDADHMNYFAYITKDLNHNNDDVTSKDVSAEVLLKDLTQDLTMELNGGHCAQTKVCGDLGEKADSTDSGLDVQDKHYCHVFCVKNTDLATEVILTLGEAFEIAYQMSLKETSISRRGSDRSDTTGTRCDTDVRSQTKDARCGGSVESLDSPSTDSIA